MITIAVSSTIILRILLVAFCWVSGGPSTLIVIILLLFLRLMI